MYRTAILLALLAFPFPSNAGDASSKQQTMIFIRNILQGGSVFTVPVSLTPSSSDISSVRLYGDGTIEIVMPPDTDHVTSHPQKSAYHIKFNIANVDAEPDGMEYGDLKCFTGACIYYENDGRTNSMVDAISLATSNSDDNRRLAKAMKHLAEFFPRSEGFFK
jgi:hypothetical protein